MANVTLPGIGEGDTQRTEVSVRQMAQQAQGMATSVAGKADRAGDTFTGPVGANTTATEAGASGLNHYLFVTDDHAVLTGGGSFLNNFNVQSTMSSALNQGGRQNFYSLLTQTAATSASNANRNYVAAAFNATSSSGDGGTGLSVGTSKGAYFGINPVAILQNGATNVLNLTGGEVNISAQTGSSVLYKTGLQIVQQGSDAVHGTGVDAGLFFSNQAGSVNWSQGIAFGTANGQFPLISTGTILASFGGTVAAGVDLSATTVTGAAFKSNGFSVDGVGTIVFGNAKPTGSITLPNSTGYNWNGTAGSYNGGTSGGSIFQFNTGELYFDNYEGGFNFRGAGFAVRGTLNSSGFNLPSGSVYKINGAQVVGARDTGWTAMTGTPNKAATYDVATVTLAQLAARVAQLQAILTAHGLIGA